MRDLNIRKLDGGNALVPTARLESLAGAVRGQVLTADSEGYDAARTIWNGMIDRRPALIVRCTGSTDVVQAVRFAAEFGVLTSIRGGGHNIAGNAVNDGGLMIDLSRMNSVHVDRSAGTVRVGPGATLGDVDHESLPHGLAVPTGINSTTGIAGLALGGGFGWLTRRYGMTVDSLLSAEIVTADGELRTVDVERDPELFWAIRGGGGNFGVVTSFLFRAQQVGPDVFAGLVVFPREEASTVLSRYREIVAKAPEELSVWVVMRKAPPLPFLPEEVHGTDVVVLALCHCGDPEAGAREIAPLRDFGTVLGEYVGVQPFAAWQAAFDPLLTDGARNYWKSHDFVTLEDGLLETLVAASGRMPSPHCEIFIAHLGGAASRVPADATAYAHRSHNVTMNVHGRWEDPADDDACIAWSRELFKAATPYSTGSVYVNFMTDDEQNRVQAAYGSGYARLAAVKKRYDPANLFRMNQNVKPPA
jgi:FAD/FMN-containing dehydrogenase